MDCPYWSHTVPIWAYHMGLPRNSKQCRANKRIDDKYRPFRYFTKSVPVCFGVLRSVLVVQTSQLVISMVRFGIFEVRFGPFR